MATAAALVSGPPPRRPLVLANNGPPALHHGDTLGFTWTIVAKPVPPEVAPLAAPDGGWAPDVVVPQPRRYGGANVTVFCAVRRSDRPGVSLDEHARAGPYYAVKVPNKLPTLAALEGVADPEVLTGLGISPPSPWFSPVLDVLRTSNTSWPVMVVPWAEYSVKEWTSWRTAVFQFQPAETLNTAKKAGVNPEDLAEELHVRLRVGIEMVAAVAALHRTGNHHGDITGSNVWVSREDAAAAGPTSGAGAAPSSSPAGDASPLSSDAEDEFEPGELGDACSGVWRAWVAPPAGLLGQSMGAMRYLPKVPSPEDEITYEYVPEEPSRGLDVFALGSVLRLDLLPPMQWREAVERVRRGPRRPVAKALDAIRAAVSDAIAPVLDKRSTSQELLDALIAADTGLREGMAAEREVGSPFPPPPPPLPEVAVATPPPNSRIVFARMWALWWRSLPAALAEFEACKSAELGSTDRGCYLRVVATLDDGEADTKAKILDLFHKAMAARAWSPTDRHCHPLRELFASGCLRVIRGLFQPREFALEFAPWCTVLGVRVAIETDNLEVLQWQEEAHAALTSCLTWSLTPLQYAVAAGAMQVAKWLVSRQKLNPSERTGGLDCMHLAVAAGHEELARWLARHGAPPSTDPVDTVSPLHLAAANGHLSLAQWLVKDCKVPPDCLTHRGYTPLHWACGTAQVDLVDYLSRLSGVDVNRPDVGGLTPLHICASSASLQTTPAAVTVIKMLIARGAVANVQALNCKYAYEYADEANVALFEAIHGAFVDAEYDVAKAAKKKKKKKKKKGSRRK